MHKMKIFFYITVFLTQIFGLASKILAQDSNQVIWKNSSGVSAGIGFPTGVSLFVEHEFLNGIYAEFGVGAGILYYAYYDFNGGLKFHLGSDSSSAVLAVRYSFF